MKILLILPTTFVVLFAVAGPGAAQQKGVEGSRPAGVELKPPPIAGNQSVDKAASKQVTGEITGTVTGVDRPAKTFTVMAYGRAITFSAARLGKLPAPGENINIPFTLNQNQLPMAMSTSAAGSAARPHMGGKQHCFHPLVGHHDPLLSLNVCSY